MKCLRERKAAQHVSAIDREEVLGLARPYLDASATPGSSLAHRLVAESDLVVLATPVGAIVRDLPWALDAVDAKGVVTDTGSVKKGILEAAGRHPKGARFVGGHPMAGREVGGFEASSAGLFEQTQWFVVQSARGAAGERVTASPDPDALARILELARVAGAAPTVIDADAHDRAMAYVSHVPQLLASALYGAAARAGLLREAGSGFRDVTRIAGGPSPMWHDIFAANGERIAAALGDILEPLARVRDALAEGGAPGIAAALSLLEAAHTARQAMLSAERAAREPAS